jgi:hypothetical protein
MVMWNALQRMLPQGWANHLERIAFSLWGSVAFVSAVFAARGLAGAFQSEISALAACVAATLAAGVCLLALACYRATPCGAWSRRQTQLALGLTVVPPVLLGAVLCPASSSLGMAWVTLLGVGLSLAGQLIVRSSVLQAAAEQSPETLPVASALPQAMNEPDLTQWMKRKSIVSDGEILEQIEGLGVVEFSPGQQHAAMHLSICPPLASAPEIECETQDGIEWKVTALHPYGVRLELRRSASLGESVNVGVSYTMAAAQPKKLSKAA